jgi:hypothetical protein
MVIPEYRDSLSGETFFSWTNVKEHAPSPAGASVDSSERPEPSATPENTAAGDGCRVSSCSHLSLLRIALGIVPKRLTKGVRGAVFILLLLLLLPYGCLEQLYYRRKLADNRIKLRRGTWLLYGWARAVTYAVGIRHAFHCCGVKNREGSFGFLDILFPANSLLGDSGCL